MLNLTVITPSKVNPSISVLRFSLEASSSINTKAAAAQASVMEASYRIERVLGSIGLATRRRTVHPYPGWDQTEGICTNCDEKLFWKE